MIASIKLDNFFSFNNCKVDFSPHENILVGINGAGKSNLLKAVKLLKEGVTGIGFKELIIQNWGGFDAIFNYSNIDGSAISVEYEFDCKALRKYGFFFTENVIYKISIKKVPSTSNFYIEEQIGQRSDSLQTPLIYLEIQNGSGIVSTNQ